MSKYQTFEACTACGKYTENGNCYHHVKTRKSGGSDDYRNLMPLCFSCHALVHWRGLTYFADNNPKVKKWLERNQWEINDFTGKWTNSFI